MAKKKPKKKARLRNAEYYDLQDTLDALYAKSKKSCCFQNLMQYVTSEDNIKLAYRISKRIRAAGHRAQTVKQSKI